MFSLLVQLAHWYVLSQRRRVSTHRTWACILSRSCPPPPLGPDWLPSEDLKSLGPVGAQRVARGPRDRANRASTTSSGWRRRAARRAHFVLRQARACACQGRSGGPPPAPDPRRAPAAQALRAWPGEGCERHVPIPNVSHLSRARGKPDAILHVDRKGEASFWLHGHAPTIVNEASETTRSTLSLRESAVNG